MEAKSLKFVFTQPQHTLFRCVPLTAVVCLSAPEPFMFADKKKKKEPGKGHAVKLRFEKYTQGTQMLSPDIVTQSYLKYISLSDYKLAAAIQLWY